MEERYHPELVELKWQAYWKENQLFKVIEDPLKEKYYLLEMWWESWAAKQQAKSCQT